MFKNQYIICKTAKKNFPEGFTEHKFEEFNIYAHKSLSITCMMDTPNSICLLGFIIDPFNPLQSNEEIVRNLLDKSNTVDDLIGYTHSLSGRFVLLVKFGTQYFVLGDACHYRQILYGENEGLPVVTSSPKLFLDFFNLAPDLNHEKRYVINHPLFINAENSWYGTAIEDDHLLKLLPNHYYNLSASELRRMPMPVIQSMSEQDIMDYVARVLQGTYQALNKRYRLIQGLTAGWDTRLLLAASKNVKDDIEYYVFNRDDKKGSKSDDTRTAVSLSRKLGLTFKVIEQQPLDSEFLELYKQEHILPRILPKTANIQYFYRQAYPSDVVNVSGNCAGIYKHAYGYTKGKIGLDHLLVFSGYHSEMPFMKKEIERWHEGAKEFAQSINIPLLDLFFWELRVGNWGSVFPFEQDMALEEVSPFNHRMLILHMLRVNPAHMISPDYKFIRKIIIHLWPEAFKEPVNKNINFLWTYIKGYSHIKYLALKARFLLFKKPALKKQLRNTEFGLIT